MNNTQNNIEKFARIANKLLNSSFLIKDKSRDEYAFFEQNKTEFEIMLGRLGYDIICHTRECIIQLVNKYEEGNRLKLKKEQSIILLLLRRLYIEEKMKIRETSEVFVSLGDLMLAYSNMFEKSKKRLDNNTVKESLILFKKYQLVNYDKGLTNAKHVDDFRVEIYHTICLALISSDLDSMLQHTKDILKSYTKGEERNEVDED